MAVRAVAPGSGGGSNPFNQNLNTTDNVVFNNLSVAGTGAFGGNVQTGTTLEVRNAGSATNKVVVQHDGVNGHVFAQSGFLVVGGSGADTVVFGTTQCFPVNNNTIDWGIAANRFKTVFGVLGDFSGNVAVQAVSPAWGAQWPAINIGVGGSITGNTVQGLFALYNNLFFDGSAYKYRNSEAGAIYQVAGGTHAWYTAPVGVAGAVATVTQRMLLDINGNLSISGGLQGVIDGSNAAAGIVGEFVEAIVTAAAPVALVSGTPKDMVTINLTAGDWDVGGSVLTENVGSTATVLYGALTTVANTIGNDEFRGAAFATAPGTSGLQATLARRRFSLTATTTIRLVASSTFTGGTLGVCGFINARRVR